MGSGGRQTGPVSDRGRYNQVIILDIDRGREGECWDRCRELRDDGCQSSA